MTDTAAAAGTLETPKDAGKGPAGEVARWLMEIELADKAEEEWRKAAADVVARIRDDKRKGKRGKAQYNILASNVATLKPALYAHAPRPDIRPRQDIKDPVAGAVAKLLEEAVSFHLDAYDFDCPMKAAVHDTLGPGRAVSRIRYKPHFQKRKPSPVGVKPMETEDDAEGEDEGASPKYVREDNGEPVEKPETGEDGSLYVQDPEYDAKVHEETCVEHVHWDDYRRGPGRSWEEIPWHAFRHKLTREECIEKCGQEIGSRIELDYCPDGVEEKKGQENLFNSDVFKRAVAWEIWDKPTRKVYWIFPSFKERPGKVEDDPLNLEGFFPIPRPLYANPDPNNAVPVEDFRIYRDQADELDTITRRISIITAGLKFRGIYDSQIKDFADLMKGEDNEFLPATNATAITQNGGLEKALFFLPIERAATVLQQLYRQRAEVKQEIFELSGVADIMRGASNANETLGAQKIKAQWGTQRLQERQREVQRYARDLIRLMVEVIAEKYDPMTLKLMTGTEVTPDMLQIMRLDGPRSFRIDIETDSTIAVDTEADQSNLAELTQGLGQLMQSLGPMVQGGAIPMDAAKKIVSSIVRRFKLGREVEDALDAAVQAPANQNGQPGQPGQDPAAQAAAAKAQAEQQVMAAETQARMTKAQADQAATQQKQAIDKAKHEAEIERIANERARAAAEHQAAMAELASKTAIANAKTMQAQQGATYAA